MNGKKKLFVGNASAKCGTSLGKQKAYFLVRQDGTSVRVEVIGGNDLQHIAVDSNVMDALATLKQASKYQRT